MRVQVTFDDRGVSVWPIDTKLKYQDNEWFDTDCRVRGTNGLKDFDCIERMIGRDMTYGDRVILDVTEIKEVDKNGSMP